ncbi:bifunctional DNA-binding transcriptional regulator/O6-methylguanine-DNA methyltransferase Ada [Pseudomonas sp. LRF_L74]|uniref:bifunctional DNA-binding transcriptional regulator/O6-methylguanine-DNA methyltransferase Ada n=1 Tax=Pseudomonas sp. LRF_L74 TaxID=3369422 RepID=UPI003F61F561
MLDAQRCWQAVCERDAACDEHFVFAVRSTGIYCRPSCPARRPERANVSFHPDAQAAEAAGFRPCRRCSPHGQSPARQLDELVVAACALLEENPALTLARLAERIGLSPSHLVRAFKLRTGTTPRGWVAAQRRQRLESRLPRSTSVLDAALDAGYASPSALYKEPRSLSPAKRRQKGAGESLRYAIAPCPLGHVLLAASDHGVCALLFGDEQRLLIEELQQRFAAAELRRDQAGLHDWLAVVLAQVEEPARAAHLPLDLRGSVFQQRVWQSLRAIPRGQTRRYGELAEQLDSHPRAIARACASNPVGLLVPCHRVVSAGASLGGYRWGVERKARLLRDEQQTPAED